MMPSLTFLSKMMNCMDSFLTERLWSATWRLRANKTERAQSRSLDRTSELDCDHSWMVLERVQEKRTIQIFFSLASKKVKNFRESEEIWRKISTMTPMDSFLLERPRSATWKLKSNKAEMTQFRMLDRTSELGSFTHNWYWNVQRKSLYRSLSRKSGKSRTFLESKEGVR